MAMTEEAKKARAAYKRRWAQQHPEKVKEYQRRHWEKVAAEAADRSPGAAVNREAQHIDK